MKDILIIREEKSKDEAILALIRNRYETVSIDFDSAQAENSAASYEYKLVIVFIEELKAASMLELRRIMMYLKNVHFCFIGSHTELEKYKEYTEKENVHCIDKSLSVDDFLYEFEFMLGENSDLSALVLKGAERKRSILLVDDDPVCLRNMTNWLKNFYHVSVAKSGAACISFLGKNKPDLILLDYEMPVCDGLQTLEMIRNEADYAEIPVIFLTGVSDMDKVKEALKLKPQGYILKNTDRIDFLNKVNQIFGN